MVSSFPIMEIHGRVRLFWVIQPKKREISYYSLPFRILEFFFDLHGVLKPIYAKISKQSFEISV
jgi:hypothetical protein